MRVPNRSSRRARDRAASTPPAFLSTQVTEAHRYFLNLNPPKRERLAVVCGGVERCREDYRVRRRTFPYWALEFVAEGEGRLQLKGRGYRLRPGMAFAYGPGVPHEITTETRHRMLKYYVDFAGSEARALLESGPLGRWEPVQLSDPNGVTELLEHLQRTGENHGPLSVPMCAHWLGLLLLSVQETAVAVGASPAQAFATYQRIRRHLLAHFREVRHLEELARACHVDVAYLCRLFQRFDRRSPYQLLLRLKMNAAAGLLLDTGLLIKQVAAQLGFNDPFHFSRVFKRVYGLSPGQFLQRGRRGVDGAEIDPP